MDDIVSIDSVQPIDQLSFWCLTLSAMLKLVAVGVTLFTLPFNEWILLQGAQFGGVKIIRGISGSDCVSKRKETEDTAGAIRCVHWADTEQRRAEFWANEGLGAAQIDMPGAVFRALFSLVLLQLALFLLDLGATLVMCCRYKQQKGVSTMEKRVSLSLSVAILCLYLFVVASVALANGNFAHFQPQFESSFGIAFKLYLGMAFLYAFGCALTHFSRLMALRQEGESIWQGFKCGGRSDGEEEANGRRRQRKRDEQMNLG
ncbi:hypothetical protein niasHS_007390 [Heterodera schachtii]|uniref:Uncharacterized protein n=1 Tax=Heterodera schachtii TaxID=97005 RepID=A0ABD2JXE7_HETSC